MKGVISMNRTNNALKSIAKYVITSIAYFAVIYLLFH